MLIVVFAEVAEKVIELLNNDLVNYIMTGVIAFVGVALGLITMGRKAMTIMSTLFNTGNDSLKQSQDKLEKSEQLLNIATELVKETSSELEQYHEDIRRIKEQMDSDRIAQEQRMNEQFAFYQQKNDELLAQNIELQNQLARVNNVPKALAKMVKEQSTPEQVKSGYVREMCDILGQNDDNVEE